MFFRGRRTTVPISTSTSLLTSVTWIAITRSTPAARLPKLSRTPGQSGPSSSVRHLNASFSCFINLDILLHFRRAPPYALSIFPSKKYHNILYSQGRASTTKTGHRTSRTPMTWVTRFRRILGLIKTLRPCPRNKVRPPILFPLFFSPPPFEQ